MRASRRRMAAAAAWPLIAVLGGCSLIDALGGKPVGEADAGSTADAGPIDCDAQKCREIAGEFVVEPTRDLDVLFVIDNSGTMASEQTALASSFQQLTSTLDQLPGGLPNVHIGVVSTDLGIGGFPAAGCVGDGDGAELQDLPRVGGCVPPAPQHYIVDIADATGTGRVRNYSQSLPETFACIASLGTVGCGFEQPFEAMRRALDGSVTANNGFLRANAYLAIIFVTDEDDCSVFDTRMFDPSQGDITSPLGPFSSFRCTEFGVECDGAHLPRQPGDYTTCAPRADSPYMHHPEFYAEFLRLLKPAGFVFLSAIAGPTQPFSVVLDMDQHPALDFSCGMMGAAAQASPGVRIADLMGRFQGRSTFSSICNEDFTPAIGDLGQVLTATISGNCLFGLLLDVSGDPGLQPDCKVYDVVARGTAEEMRTEIPACGLPPVPTCFHLTENLADCPFSPEHLSIEIERTGAPPPPGTIVVVECYRP